MVHSYVLSRRFKKFVWFQYFEGAASGAHNFPFIIIIQIRYYYFTKVITPLSKCCLALCNVIIPTLEGDP